MPITKKGAMELIQSEYKVPKLIRQARRRRKPNEGRLTRHRTCEAAEAPQSGLLIPTRGQCTALRTYNQ
jgi:hypothetical protein